MKDSRLFFLRIILLSIVFEAGNSGEQIKESGAIQSTLASK
jgi:hypothetical protein